MKKNLKIKSRLQFSSFARLTALCLFFLTYSSVSLQAQTADCYADAVVSNVILDCNVTANYSDPTAALGAPNYVPPYTSSVNQFYSMGSLNSELILAFTDNALTNSGTTDPDLFIYEIGPSVEQTDVWLLPINVATANSLTTLGLIPDADGFFSFGTVVGATSAVDIDAFTGSPAPGTLIFNQIKLINPIATQCFSDGVGGPDIDAVCALSSIPCTNVDDDDCDGIGNVCDICPGGDDNGPCNALTLPPINTLPAYWLCSNNGNNEKIKVCHDGNTLCVSENAAATHLAHGDFLGPCQSCEGQNLVAPGNNGINATAPAQQHELELFPNPASHEINIHFNRHAPTATLRITDILGRVVFEKEIEEGTERMTINLNDSQFENGLYLVSLFQGGEMRTSQLVVQR